MDIIQEIKNFVPLCPQEQRDKAGILRFLAGNPDAFERENLTAHMTASAWVLSPDRRQVVMVYHNIYNSWSWTGGHADGDRDLLAVASRGGAEETGAERRGGPHPGVFSPGCPAVGGPGKRGQEGPHRTDMDRTHLPGGAGPERREFDPAGGRPREEGEGVRLAPGGGGGRPPPQGPAGLRHLYWHP